MFQHFKQVHETRFSKSRPIFQKLIWAFPSNHFSFTIKEYGQGGQARPNVAKIYPKIVSVLDKHGDSLP